MCRTWVCEAGRVDDARERQREKRRKGQGCETGPERWKRWRQLLEEGAYGTKAELARAEGVSRAAATMGLQKLVAGWHG